jgi:hypothetical protein
MNTVEAEEEQKPCIDLERSKDPVIKKRSKVMDALTQMTCLVESVKGATYTTSFNTWLGGRYWLWRRRQRRYGAPAGLRTRKF